MKLMETWVYFLWVTVIASNKKIALDVNFRSENSPVAFPLGSKILKTFLSHPFADQPVFFVGSYFGVIHNLFLKGYKMLWKMPVTVVMVIQRWDFSLLIRQRVQNLKHFHRHKMSVSVSFPWDDWNAFSENALCSCKYVCTWDPRLWAALRE